MDDKDEWLSLTMRGEGQGRSFGRLMDFLLASSGGAAGAPGAGSGTELVVASGSFIVFKKFIAMLYLNVGT